MLKPLSFVVQVIPCGGVSITEAISEGIELAARLGCVIEFDFNAITVVLSEASDAKTETEKCYLRWRAKVGVGCLTPFPDIPPGDTEAR